MQDIGHTNGTGNGTVPPPLIEFDFTRRAKKVELDFSKRLKWLSPTDEVLGEFHYLVKHPPIHTVVIEIGPAMAEQLLVLCNENNRPQIKNHVVDYRQDMESGNFEETGDTVKFADTGRLLDGQHRLSACVAAGKPFVTDVKFGLDEKVFDVLDQGRKRTGGEICHQLGVADPKYVAGAIGWVERLMTGQGITGGVRGRAKPRRVGQLAVGDLDGMSEYVKPAKMICLAYKNQRHPPTMLMALLYLIGQQSKALAFSFADEWVHGSKVGRNRNFDVLSGRLLNIARVNNGTINRSIRAALLIQTFNYWHAGLVASPRSLVWQSGWVFPRLEFNKDRFAKQKDMEAREDTSAAAVNHRVLQALTNHMDSSSEVSLAAKEIADIAKVHPNSVDYVLGELKRGGFISRVRPAAGARPATYRVVESAATIVSAA